jgi:hypothetical protein
MYKMLIYFQIQFQLNRLSKCEMHAAIDGISTLDLVFPPPEKIPTIPRFSVAFVLLDLQFYVYVL